jgi:hypothetical protein
LLAEAKPVCLPSAPESNESRLRSLVHKYSSALQKIIAIRQKLVKLGNSRALYESGISLVRANLAKIAAQVGPRDFAGFAASIFSAVNNELLRFALNCRPLSCRKKQRDHSP